MDFRFWIKVSSPTPGQPCPSSASSDPLPYPMHQSRWLKTLKCLGLEFWIALPLLGIAFWVGGGLVTDQILSRSYESKEQLQANTKLKGKSAKVVLAIKVEINYTQGIPDISSYPVNSYLLYKASHFNCL